MLQLPLQRRVIAGSVKVSDLGAFLFLLVQRWPGTPPRRFVGVHAPAQATLHGMAHDYAGDGLIAGHDTSDSLFPGREVFAGSGFTMVATAPATSPSPRHDEGGALQWQRRPSAHVLLDQFLEKLLPELGHRRGLMAALAADRIQHCDTLRVTATLATPVPLRPSHHPARRYAIVD
jgi:hypothetical protein